MNVGVSSAASCCTYDLLEIVVRCLGGGASSPRSPRASGAYEIHGSVSQINDSLYVLHKPAAGTPNIQILFFHGLQSGLDYSSAHVSTWRNRDGSSIWPQTWLVEDFPEAHVLSVCYTEGLGVNGSVDMYIVGENLLSDLLLEKIGSSCPVVLVGHSIGGLVIKQLCCHAHDKLSRTPKPEKAKVEAFLNNIKGIFYYSTPHRGSPIANRLKDHFGSRLLTYFEMLSTAAARLNSTFDQISRKHLWLLAGLGETLPTDLGPFVDWVVPEASTRVADFNLVTGADHFSICRPSGKISRSFSKLREFIYRIANEATTSAVNRLPLLRFLQDPKYVVLKTTEIKVREAVERKTPGRVVTLFGGPGEGKTSMAKYLALYYQHASSLMRSPTGGQDEHLAKRNLASSRFIGGVVFLSCGPKMGIRDLLRNLWENLDYQLSPSNEFLQGYASSNNVIQEFLTPESLLYKELTKRLLNQEVLIILDDVHDHTLIETLLSIPGKGLKFLITTRKPELWGDRISEQIAIIPPTSEEACQILKNHVYGGHRDISQQEVQDAIAAIVEKADHHPLVLANIAAYIQCKDMQELDDWQDTLKYFEDRIQAEAGKSVLFGHTYTETVKASMTIALSSLSKEAQTLLLVASIFEIKSTPEVVFKLFFKRQHVNLSMFSSSSRRLQDNNFVQVDCDPVPGGTGPLRSWSVHGMRKMFTGIIKESEVKSMVNTFLKGTTNDDDILIELLLVYGQEKWREQAEQRLGIPSWIFQLAPIQSFVWLLHADSEEEWKKTSHQLAKQILHRYIYRRELDDNSVSVLLSTKETYLYTCIALRDFCLMDPSRVVIPKTIRALVNLLEPASNEPADVRSIVLWLLAAVFLRFPDNKLDFRTIPHSMERLVALLADNVSDVAQQAAMALGWLAGDVESPIKIGQFSHAIESLIALLADNVSEVAQYIVAFALARLAYDVENRKTIGEFSNVIERLVALLSEDRSEAVRGCAALALANLALDDENRINIGEFPNAIDRLVALLADNVSKAVQWNAACALANLVANVENRMKIGEISYVIERLAAVLTEDGSEEGQRYASQVLGNLAIDVENRIKIVQFPSVSERLVALLADNVSNVTQQIAAGALKNLAIDVEIGIKIGRIPTVIERLVALLAEGKCRVSRSAAASVLGNLALSVENRIKIGQFSHAIERLVELLPEDGMQDVQWGVTMALANLTLDVENRIKIGQFPNVMKELVALLAEDVNHNVRQQAAMALGHLALNAENRMKIAQLPNVVDRLVELLTEDANHYEQAFVPMALGNLALDVETGIKIAQSPNVIERLVALLAEDASRHCAAVALGNLAVPVENKIRIGQFPLAIERLVEILADDGSQDIQAFVLLALGNLAADVENSIKIGQFPNVIKKLVALLAEDVNHNVRQQAAMALANLSQHEENRIEMGQFTNVIGRLVAMLAEDRGEDAPKYAASILGNLALDDENGIKIAQSPNVIERLLALLAEDVSEDTQTSAAGTLTTLLSEQISQGDFQGALLAQDVLGAIDPTYCDFLMYRILPLVNHCCARKKHVISSKSRSTFLQ